MTEPTTNSDDTAPQLSYVEEITDPATGDVTTYRASTPEELEAAITADWRGGDDRR